MIEKGKYHYFIVVLESLYPDSSYYEPKEFTFDSEEEALAYAKDIAEEEKKQLEENTHLDFLDPALYRENDEEVGYVVSPKNGLDDWGCFARVLKIKTKV